MSSISYALRLSHRLCPPASAHSRQRSSQLLRRMLLWSLLLHGLVALLILISVELTPPPEPQSPPGIAMVFESGAPKPPTVANPDRGRDFTTSRPTPPGAAAAPPTAPASPAPQMLTMPQALPAQPASPPLATRPAPPQNAAPATPIAPAPPPSPSQSAGLVPLPMPPPPPAQRVLPRTLPPPAPRAPRPRAQPQREPRPASPFAAPMEFSFGNTAPRGRSSENPATGFLGPSAAEGEARASSQVGDSIQATGPARPGRDWFSALEAWMEAHKYYPREAAMNGEDGVVVVHVVVDRSGHVDSVELRSRSGSQWLDLGAQAMFRGAHLPAFPPDTPFPDVDLQVTIHYILIRR